MYHWYQMHPIPESPMIWIVQSGIRSNFWCNSFFTPAFQSTPAVCHINNLTQQVASKTILTWTPFLHFNTDTKPVNNYNICSIKLTQMVSTSKNGKIGFSNISAASINQWSVRYKNTSHKETTRLVKTLFHQPKKQPCQHDSKVDGAWGKQWNWCRHSS